MAPPLELLPAGANLCAGCGEGGWIGNVCGCGRVIPRRAVPARPGPRVPARTAGDDPPATDPPATYRDGDLDGADAWRQIIERRADHEHGGESCPWCG
jgi:hypothetical protein